jgi:hypothetical protein
MMRALGQVLLLPEEFNHYLHIALDASSIGSSASEQFKTDLTGWFQCMP